MHFQGFQIQKYYTLSRFSDPKIVYTSKASRSEISIHFQVACSTRLIFREGKDGGSGGEAPWKSSGFWGGRKPPNLVTGTQTPTRGMKFQSVTGTLSATRLSYSNPAGLLPTGQHLRFSRKRRILRFRLLSREQVQWASAHVTCRETCSMQGTTLFYAPYVLWCKD